MASEFIGYTIVVTLNSPPPTQQLQGIVADVLEQQLVLKDGSRSKYPYSHAMINLLTAQSPFSGMPSTSRLTASILQPLRTWKW
jgi:hypothetical protein